MDIKTISFQNRQQINDFIKFNWYFTVMVIRGEAVDMTTFEMNLFKL